MRQIAEILAGIGYAPVINLGDLNTENKPVVERSFYYKLGLAGFAFGNIMLLSFPEYLGLQETDSPYFVRLFGYLNILLILPVVFYSARDYWKSAWLGLKHGDLNIDVPVTLGIFTLFGRSVFEILSLSEAGYLDSLAGLVFFLLLGRWFQQRTYHNISFDRDYKSYFPIAATRLEKEGSTSTVSLDKLEPGDRIMIRNGEIVPADAIILKGHAQIDYSFVTGEAEPVTIPAGEKIFAGGRQVGGLLELSLIRKVSQSYLTQLWNDEAFHKDQETQASKLANTVGRYFTIVILAIAGLTLAWWLPKDIPLAINAFTAVLIIACPCAVALSVPFTFGNVLRILGKQGFYLKNTNIIEALSAVDTTVFDKTGTLTLSESGGVQFMGPPLSREELKLVQSLSFHSNHPASRRIYRALIKDLGEPAPEVQVSEITETPGMGISGLVGHRLLRLGSYSFMHTKQPIKEKDYKGVYLEIDGELKGYFELGQMFRPGAREALHFFNELGPVYLLSGDNDRQRALLESIFPEPEHMHFQKSPREKLEFIRQLQTSGQHVLMLGDGLNDAGALRESEVGLVVTENTNNFTPASDAILRADQFDQLPKYLRFTRRSLRIVYAAYGFAFLYNLIGLSFAVRGALSPVVAAVLMPLSSITIVLIGILAGNWMAWRMGLFENNIKQTG